jgi:hypothetical protein
MKPEKRFPRDPVEGSEASGQGTVEGEHEQDIGLAFRVNETSADSETGTQRSLDLRSRMR